MHLRPHFLGILVFLLVMATTFEAVQLAIAQDTPIFGYPYDTNGISSIAESYSFYGARFTLNGNATINSISCKLWISYDSNQPNAISHYRYAIYQDNAGSVRNLIAQTEIGSDNTPVDGPYNNDKWRTLNLATPVSLNTGTYWLIAVDDSPVVSIHNEPMTAETHDIVLGSLSSIDFPLTLNTETTSANTTYSIYASGQGVSSVMPPPTSDTSHPGVSALSVNCQGADISTNEIEVFGSLTSYGVAIPDAAISFLYRGSSDSNWQQFAMTNTSADGSFSVNWLPPSPGNYMINATYWGDTLHSFVFTAINVLVTSIPDNQTHQVFSVDSNSTVTALTFDSDNNALSFSVSGEEGTMGYAVISIDKNIVADTSAIQAYIDGKVANFTVQQTHDVWLLYFTYHHSTHYVEFLLNKRGGIEISELGAILALAFLLIVALAILYFKKRKH